MDRITENLTFVHQMSNKDNEQSIYEIHKVREYRDITTDKFTNSIIGPRYDHSRYTFLDFTFHYINTKLHMELNTMLIKETTKPLNVNEDVHFVFKGGNVMNIMYAKYLANYNGTNLNVAKIRTIHPNINNFKAGHTLKSYII